MDLGWHDDSVCYRLNSQGFRCDEFDRRPSGVAIGASVTFGVGVPESAAWHQIMAHELEMPVWNLGTEGAAMDTCYRVLAHFVQRLDVKFAVLVPPPGGRFEIMAQHGRYQIFGMHMDVDKHRDYVKEWLLSDENAQTNQDKNIRAMRDICRENGVMFWCADPDQIPCDGLARDLLHPGVEAHRTFGQTMAQIMEEQRCI